MDKAPAEGVADYPPGHDRPKSGIDQEKTGHTGVHSTPKGGRYHIVLRGIGALTGDRGSRRIGLSQISYSPENPMRPVAQRIAIVGFSAFERRTLESYFRLVDAVPVYTVDGSVAECDWLVADADQPEAVYTVGQAGRVRDTVFIGGSKTPATAGAHLSRPIDAMQLRRALDDLKNRRAARALRESGLTPRLRLAATGPSGLTRQQCRTSAPAPATATRCWPMATSGSTRCWW
jgi:hypothetical protein